MRPSHGVVVGICFPQRRALGRGWSSLLRALGDTASAALLGGWAWETRLAPQSGLSALRVPLAGVPGLRPLVRGSSFRAPVGPGQGQPRAGHRGWWRGFAASFWVRLSEESASLAAWIIHFTLLVYRGTMESEGNFIKPPSVASTVDKWFLRFSLVQDAENVGLLPLFKLSNWFGTINFQLFPSGADLLVY